MSSNFYETVSCTIKNYDLVQKGNCVIVALSGGADSVSLLRYFISIKEEYNLTLYACHLNHNIRGKEAKRDEEFCKNLCKQYNVQLFVRNENILELAKSQKISEELCGRNERYKFFSELSIKYNAKVATAHTLSDKVETMLYNIARGTSLSGLSSIPPKRDYIIRPLIDCTRLDVEQYCKMLNQEYVTDSTNLSDDYTRNKIRHSVVTTFKEINPSFEKTAQRLCSNSAEISNLLNKLSTKAEKECKVKYGYSCQKLLEQDIAVLKNLLYLLLKQKKITAQYHSIDLLVGIIKNGGSLDLSENVTAISKQGIFRLEKTEHAEISNIELKEDYSFEYDSKKYSVKEINTKDIDLNSNENTVFIDISLLKKNPVFRNRKSGDTFSVVKRNVSKKLRKLLNEQKVPSEKRDKILVLAIDSTILWCENIGVSNDGKVKDNSKFALKITIE